MGMINDDAVLRLESNQWKRLRQHIFEVAEGEMVAFVSSLFIPESMSTESITPKPLHLDHSSDSLWV